LQIANISRLEQDIVHRKMALQLRSLPYMPTKYGELWSTNGENGAVFQPTHLALECDTHPFAGVRAHPLQSRPCTLLQLCFLVELQCSL